MDYVLGRRGQWIIYELVGVDYVLDRHGQGIICEFVIVLGSVLGIG